METEANGMDRYINGMRAMTAAIEEFGATSEKCAGVLTELNRMLPRYRCSTCGRNVFLEDLRWIDNGYRHVRSGRMRGRSLCGPVEQYFPGEEA